VVAVVVLQVVDVPGGPALRVLRFVVEAAFVARAGHLAGGGVHAVEETFVVEHFGDRFHSTGEAGAVDDDSHQLDRSSVTREHLSNQSRNFGTSIR
jgi:hypothetical protein